LRVAGSPAVVEAKISALHPPQEITPRDAGDSREPNVALVARHQLPTVSPTKYELAIDLKNTKARGIDIPPTVGRADEVTE